MIMLRCGTHFSALQIVRASTTKSTAIPSSSDYQSSHLNAKSILVQLSKQQQQQQYFTNPTTILGQSTSKTINQTNQIFNQPLLLACDPIVLYFRSCPLLHENNSSPAENDFENNKENLRRLHNYVEICLPEFFTSNYFTKFHQKEFYDQKNFTFKYSIGGKAKVVNNFNSFVYHKWFIQKYYQFMFSWTKLTILSLKEIEEENFLDVTVRLHTLKKRVNLPPKITGAADFDKENELMRMSKWDEYRILIHLNKKGLINHIRITQLTPPEVKNTEKVLSWFQRILTRRAPAV